MPETQVKVPSARVEPTSGQPPAPGSDTYVTVIRPPTALPRLPLSEIWRYRELLGIFVWRDIKVRYKQTVIGGVWVVFQPLLTAVVYTLIFGRFAKFNSAGLPYPLFAFAGMIAWQYFSGSLNVSSSSLVSNVPLLTKVYFPRLLLPLAGVLTPLVDFLVSIPILIWIMAWFHIWPGLNALLAPAFILLALVAALGAGLVFSALNVRYRDIPYVIPAFMQVMPLLSAVPFTLENLPPKWQWLLSVNPMTTVVAGWRWCVLNGPPLVLGQALLSAGVAVTLFILGIVVFMRLEPRFADKI